MSLVNRPRLQMHRLSSAEGDSLILGHIDTEAIAQPIHMKHLAGSWELRSGLE